MSERILIAGCGDLGQRVARLLLARGDEVYALRRHPPNRDDSLRWLAADLASPETLASLPTGITQLIFVPAPDARQPDIYRAVFLSGLRNVLDALDNASLQRVLFVSSSAVYGEHGDEWVDEATRPAPPGFNGQVLLDAERALSKHPVDSIVLRLAGLYGPGRLQLIDRLRAGRVNAPRQQKHWANRIHVEDAAAAIVHLLGLREHQSLYVGVDDTPLPLDVLYDALAALAGAPPASAGPAPAGIGSKRLSNARLKASGFRLRWPDSRIGYAALLQHATSAG
ncbi:NAD-dependent epimerase/dehydratase family protein [Dyella choica]|uniref:NAD-dependent epimerase/dehydratase family protein n=1 Tax=Dyella choica TaxID=1927959 RepID=A0A3S0PJH8_9GAMM|nr:NAD-dependent epimerase/dehydratase family protein [Dyella choica]RUL76864.1 NAD-dependent epimerase/dehydratase family protein [Dyella choica]